MFIRLNGRKIGLPVGLQEVENADLRAFLREWCNENPYVVGHTSGSTGTPKEIRLAKADLRASARITNEYFGIRPESVLLLCLSVGYIAGKMMVVRALEAGAELKTGEVSSRPLRHFPDGGYRVDLAAMVPMQVEETLKCPEEKAKLNRIRHLLIGGAEVSPVLERRLQHVAGACYATYGMTETASHVALKRLNRDTAYFALGEVSFEADRRNCLVICAPHLNARRFITNDRVELLDSRHFNWLGRFDYVINSGGIKFSPELLERKIAACIPERFFIAGRPDGHLGQRIVLAVEKTVPEKTETDRLREKLKKVLAPYEMPREIVYIPRFPTTSSGKILRRLD